MPLKRAACVLAGLLAATHAWAQTPADPPRLTLADEPFVSKVLRDNRIGLNPERSIKVFLPPSYAQSTRRYPVVYFLHNAWWGPKQMVEDGRAQRADRTGVRGWCGERVHLRGGGLHGPNHGQFV